MSTVDVKTITLNEVLFHDDLIIDVRSPAEFAEYHIPNAVNIPLFSNEERAKIGTVYKQKSQADAIELGVSLYGPKLPTFYQEVKSLKEKKGESRIVIYCWRGGMRSRTVAGTLGLVGIDCFQLVGGVRSFRKSTQDRLDAESKRERNYIVIAGHTGTRKTEILERLQEEGFPVLDLEGLAAHRGSIFGHIGLTPNSQKQFEYNLTKRLEELKDADTLIIEAESKRIGHIIIPDFILAGKENGIRIELDYPFWSRVEHIYRTYKPEKNGEAINAAIAKMNKFLSHELKQELDKLIEEQEYRLVFARLLEYYYDPRYSHSSHTYHSNAIHLSFESIDEAVEQLKMMIQRYL